MIDLPICTFRYTSSSILFHSEIERKDVFYKTWNAYLNLLPQSFKTSELPYLKHHVMNWLSEMMYHASLTFCAADPTVLPPFLEYIHTNRFPNFTINLVLTITNV